MLLPPELIDHIFSFLQGDILALKACSEVHPLYSRLAEPHLYSHIVFKPPRTEICIHILQNTRLLDYPRTLDIRTSSFDKLCPVLLSLMTMIPRMVNLVSLTIQDLPMCVKYHSVFRRCLQQSSFQQLSLLNNYGFPLSILDGAKNIKHLTLSYCTTDRDQPAPGLPSSQLSLETLILRGVYHANFHCWVMRWVTHLTTLEILGLAIYNTAELLATCSNSLTRLHLSLRNCCMSFLSIYNSSNLLISINLVNENFKIPFITLSALMRLKRLTISAYLSSTNREYDEYDEWPLPDIIRIIKTAPAIQEVDLQFYFCGIHSTSSLVRLDWSPFGHLQSSFTGTRPRINLCVTSESRITGPFSPESILDALMKIDVLMDSVERGLVVLKSLLVLSHL